MCFCNVTFVLLLLLLPPLQLLLLQRLLHDVYCSSEVYKYMCASGREVSRTFSREEKKVQHLSFFLRTCSSTDATLAWPSPCE